MKKLFLILIIILIIVLITFLYCSLVLAKKTDDIIEKYKNDLDK